MERSITGRGAVIFHRDKTFVRTMKHSIILVMVLREG